MDNRNFETLEDQADRTLDPVRFGGFSSGGCHGLEIWGSFMWNPLPSPEIGQGGKVYGAGERALGASSLAGWEGREVSGKETVTERARQQETELLSSTFLKQARGCQESEGGQSFGNRQW